MQESRNHNAGTRHDSPIPISLTNTYSLTLRYPTGVDLPTYTPHSQYIHPLSRVPTGVDLPTYILPFLFSIPTHTVRGRGVRGVVCYLWAMLSLAGGQCQMRFVRAVSTDGVSYL